MGQLTVAEASAVDFLHACDDTGAPRRFRRRDFGYLARQVDDGAAFTVRDEAGRLCLIVGLYPHEWGAEAWFSVGEGARANLLPSIRIAKALLEQIASDVAPVEIRAFVRSVAGARLAAWFGFQNAGVETSHLGELEVWKRRFS